MVKMGLFVFLMSFLSCSIVTAAEQMLEEESCSQSSEKEEILRLAMVELKKNYGVRGFVPVAYVGREFWSKEKSKLEKKCEELYPQNYSLSLQDLIKEDPNLNGIISKFSYDQYRSALHLNHLFFTSLDGINSLSYDGINSLSDFKYLNELYISHSKLQKIEPSFFEGCVHLKKLDLSHNEFKEINAEMLIGLINLRDLNLSYNKIENIGQKTFIGSSKLHDLDLSHNKLKQIIKGQFEGLYNKLYQLNLSDNQLKTLCAEEILSIEGLQKLDIEGNLLAGDGELFEKLKEKVNFWATGFSCLDPNQEASCTPSSDDELSNEEEEKEEEEEEKEEINLSLSISEGQQPESVMERVLSFPVNHPLIAAATASAVLVAAAIVSRNPAKARRAAEGMRNRCVIS